MLTILIKSFNRPHYLDRCIRSIEKNVKGSYQIKILDDGTPKAYLKKIKATFPTVLLEKSEAYPEKIKAIQTNLETGKSINGFLIPTDLWYENVKEAQDYVLVTEDDVWFTKPIDVDLIINQMKANKTELIKLGWLGNFKDNYNLKIEPISPEIDRTIPKKLFTANEYVMDLFMFNKYKLFSIMYKLGMVDNGTKRTYWALNSILMGLYHKDYWLYMWKDSKNVINEKIQLKNAAVYYHNHKKNNNLIGRTKEEVMKTTFKSSASGSYHAKENRFDVNRYNHILNEAWLNNEFDPLENFPNDFSDSYIKTFLDKANHPAAQYDEWFLWAEKFRNQYRNLGAQVD